MSSDIKSSSESAMPNALQAVEATWLSCNMPLWMPSSMLSHHVSGRQVLSDVSEHYAISALGKVETYSLFQLAVTGQL